MLREAPAIASRVVVDGKALRDQALLIEVMNIGIIGPNLRLLPDWRPTARHLTVTWLPASARQAMVDWLAKPDGPPPPLRKRTARRIVFELEDEHLHVADKFLPEVSGAVAVARHDANLRLLIPDGTS
jgi:hypothetical protein